MGFDQRNDDAMEEFQQLQQWLKERGKSVAALAVVAGLIGIAFTSYYQIQPDEVGVVLRFGKHTPPNAGPGLHFKLPFGMDQVIKVPVERQLKMEFGFRTVSAGVESKFMRDPAARAESKMLTADRNVAIVEWIIQYKIANPEKYIFEFRNIDTTLRLMAEATMRSVVGDFTVDELITGGRERIENDARKRLQDLNTLYDTGIVIQQLKLQDANVTATVKPSLREVEEAKQERARAINLAEAERNKVIPEAKGQAQESVARAEGYSIARVNTALGDAKRFKALYVEYRKAPTVTRTRIYLEAMAEILPQAKHKVVLDTEAKGLVPLLNMATGGAK
jgi:membrane protease subunit HflK